MSASAAKYFPPLSVALDALPSMGLSDDNIRSLPSVVEPSAAGTTELDAGNVKDGAGTCDGGLLSLAEGSMEVTDDACDWSCNSPFTEEPLKALDTPAGDKAPTLFTTFVMLSLDAIHTWPSSVSFSVERATPFSLGGVIFEDLDAASPDGDF